MKKIRCLVTAGPTREYFDPVRFISNPSTGKMGCAIAAAARAKGWDTTLVLGPSALPDIDGVKTLRVVSAADMFAACQKLFDACDILIMSAAVSDVRPKNVMSRKAKKDEIDLNPQLERTPDILLELSKHKKNQILIGFAAETQNVLEYAKDKLERKNLDGIVANNVGAEGAGFAADTNKIDLILRSGEVVDFRKGSKSEVAELLVSFLSARFFNEPI